MKSDVKPFQFGIRHLLGAMFAVALVSALIAPWVRGWSAGQWLSLAGQMAAVVLVSGVVFSLHEWMRRTIRLRVGSVLFRATAQTWGQSRWSPTSAYVLLTLATLTLLLLTAVAIVSPEPLGLLLTQGAYVGALVAIVVGQIRHPSNELIVGERGVAVGYSFRVLTWETLHCSYEPRGLPGRLLLGTTGWTFEVCAPAEIEQPLAEFIQQRAKPWKQSAASEET